MRWVVGYAAGGSTDIVARLMGQRLSERLAQPFVIENRPGAGTNIGTKAVVDAAPDGYTLLLISPANAINASLYERLNFNFIRDVAPVAGIMRAPLVVVVNPSSPVKTIPELISYAAANPGKISMASGGVGVTSHVSGELFKMMAGVDMVHVPYRGEAPAIADLIGGQVQVMFPTVPAAIEQIRAGKLRALAVTTAARSEMLPDVPSLNEFLPGYEASNWWGAGVPRSTPLAVIEKLNTEINGVLADPKMKAQLADLGGTILALSPAEFAQLIDSETEKWAKVVKFSGAKPE